MKRLQGLVLSCALLGAAIGVWPSNVLAAQSTEVRCKDGSRWRGELNDRVKVVFKEGSGEITLTGTLTRVADLYLVVTGDIAGRTVDKAIFKADIVSIEDAKESDTAATEPTRVAEAKAPESKEIPRDANGKPLGVFYLPMDGMVGVEFRHDEIKKLGEHINKNYGPGQIVVLEIHSNGGLVIEALEISAAIEEIQKNHRVVAWIKKAISAGCSTAMSCEEIYFQSEGSAGSVTTLAGSASLQGEEAEKHVDDFVKLAKRHGYSEHIARAMKLNKYAVSYEKDPETGKVTFYGDDTHEHLLSDHNSNLSFNASNALHCGFSKGTADTKDELAKLLDLPRWVEIDDFGRKIAEDWMRTAKKAQEEIPLLAARLDYKGTGSGDTIEVIGARIQILEDLIRWWDRAPNVCMMSGLPPKDDLKEIVKRLRLQLAEMRRAERGR